MYKKIHRKKEKREERQAGGTTIHSDLDMSPLKETNGNGYKSINSIISCHYI